MIAGAGLAAALAPACIVWLRGDLGAGKTTLARGLIQHFDAGLRVKSPTYSLIETYALAPFMLHHLDLYRVRDPAELEALDLRELSGDVMLIEWPEQGGDATPAADVELTLSHTDSTHRGLQATAKTLRGGEVFAQLQRFLDRNGYK